MKRRSFLLFLVVSAILVIGVVAASSQNSQVCTPRVYDVNTIPFEYPSASVQGRIIPPIVPTTVYEPLVWVMDPGPLTRVGQACDPDGDPFTVKLESSTLPAEVLVDLQAGTWTLFIPNASPGVHALVVSVTDTPSDPDVTPKTSYVTVILKVRRTNSAPVLN